MADRKIKTLTILALSILLLACGEPSNEVVTAAEIKPATPPQINISSTFIDLLGAPVEVTDFQGKKVVLNYWATWCAPCIREIPALNRAAEILEDEGFIFLLASDESLEEINEFLDENDFEGNFIKLNSYFASFGVEAVPSTILFDEKGETINTWLGEYEWDSPQILEELRNSN